MDFVDRFVDPEDIVAGIATPLVHAGFRGIHWMPVVEGFVGSMAARHLVNASGQDSAWKPVVAGVLIGTGRELTKMRRGRFMDGFIEGTAGQSIAHALNGPTGRAFSDFGVPIS